MSEEIRVGDRFLVEVEVRGGPDQHASYAVTLPEYVAAHAPQVRVPEHFLLAAKRLPRALKVGDRVRRDYGPCTVAVGVIIATHANRAWIDLGGDQTTVWLLADLTLAEESAS